MSTTAKEALRALVETMETPRSRKASAAWDEARRVLAAPDAETHNGWSNRETWCVNLWLTSDEPTYRRALEAAGDSDTYAASKAVEALAREITEHPGMSGDLVNCALARVNWREIATALRDA